MNLASYIDHTILKTDTTAADIERICDEAVQYDFAAVCIPPYFVKKAAQLIGTKNGVKISTVVGFPFGYSSISAKVTEIREAINDGADEIDLVINPCAVIAGDMDFLQREITQCLLPIRLNRKTIKVIIESGKLTDEQIIQCCDFYTRHKVDYLKTSTGYVGEGASLHAVQLMRSKLPPEVGIKASGGVRDLAFAKELIGAGATRIGTSSGIQLMAAQGNIQK